MDALGRTLEILDRCIPARNAWLANAALHYVLALRRAGASANEQEPYIALAEKIGHAMQRLQDKKALGGIRYGPQNVWHAADTSAPYLEINSENNISAYAAFQLACGCHGKTRYTQKARRNSALVYGR